MLAKVITPRTRLEAAFQSASKPHQRHARSLQNKREADHVKRVHSRVLIVVLLRLAAADLSPGQRAHS